MSPTRRPWDAPVGSGVMDWDEVYRLDFQSLHMHTIRSEEESRPRQKHESSKRVEVFQ
jgi:hypothetical protein